MAEFFGDLERLAADLYPYRWPILLAIVAVVAAIAFYAYRRQWHRVVWEHRRLVIIVGTPLLVLAGFLAWDLGSPLFLNKTVEEEFPFAYSAVVPSDMEREDVETTMAVLSKMDGEPMAENISAMIREGSGEVVKLKEGDFRDQDSFHKGSGQGRGLSRPGRLPRCPAGGLQGHQRARASRSAVGTQRSHDSERAEGRRLPRPRKAEGQHW